MDWDRTRRFDDHRGGESYRPGSSRGYSRRSRSPQRLRSPPSRLVADTWVPSTGRAYSRQRSRSPPPFRRRSRSPQPYTRDAVTGPYSATYNPRRLSPRRDVRPRSPIPASRRPRSPFPEDRTRDITWKRSVSNVRRPRDSSSSGRDYGHYRKERRPPSTGRQMRSGSASRHGPPFEDDNRLKGTTRARSPFYGGRRDIATDRYSGQRRRSPSPNDNFPRRPSAPGSMSNSRRSSPFDNKINTSSRGNRSRSPPSILPSIRRRSRDRGSASYHNDRTPTPRGKIDAPEAKSGSPTIVQSSARPLPGQDGTESPRPPEIQGRTNHTKPSYPSNAPSQPKAFSSTGTLHSPPPIPPHGPKTIPSHPRASNLSLLSAPTRPRGSSNFKDSGWAGTASRRGPAPVGSHGAPTAPRSTHLSNSVVEAQRLRSSRHTSVSGTSSSPTPRYSKYLVGLNTIVPGGKLIPFDLDAISQKRPFQFEADKDRLFEQIAESQKMKRAGLRDWDKLDRESSICALKSELAEGHLQCITDTEGTLGSAIF
ncbi:uncharacterized protein BDV17DRAFT_119527 [Aspergillus undulatus]|uniref:uncharacterized protein n=1 Tax=Aspergillus undulatus TaxID=1810928 RepID=UPI003CCDC782